MSGESSPRGGPFGGPLFFNSMGKSMLTTKLDAVNAMLRTLGEAPVDSLESGLFQAETAEQILDETSKIAQTGDWDFNREEGIKLFPNTLGEIAVPANTIRIDASSRRFKVIQRSGQLYDKANHTFIFKEPLACDIVWYLSWEDLPEAARQFIYLSAARKFQMLTLGSSELAGFTQEDEQRAFLRLQQHDTDTADYNLFDSDPESSFIADRW